MSNLVNDRLIERAHELAEYWTGTQHASRIEAALKASDMDSLYLYVREAHDAMMQLEEA